MAEEQSFSKEQDIENPLVNGSVSQDQDYYFAGFWMRFWAYALDVAIVFSLNSIFIKPIFRALDLSLTHSGIISPYGIASGIVFYLYFILMTKFFRQTLGKMIFGLKVISLKEEKLSWGTVIFREGIGRYISATFNILYVVIAFTPKKQGIHDLFSDTSVIHERKSLGEPAYS